MLFLCAKIIRKHLISSLAKSVEQKKNKIVFSTPKPLPLSLNGSVYLRVAVSLKWRVFNKPDEHQKFEEANVRKNMENVSIHVIEVYYW